MFKKMVMVFIAVLSVACSEKAVEVVDQTDEVVLSESDRLNQWFETKYEEKLRFSPIELTFLGRKDLYDKIDDFSIAAEKKQLAWLASTVDELKTQFNYAKLDNETKTSFDMWVYGYELAKAGEPFMESGYIFNQMDGLHSFLPTFLINFHKVEDEPDMRAYLARISGVSRGLEQLLARAKAASDKNIRPPAFAYEIVAEEIEKLITGKPFDNSDVDAPLWLDAKSKMNALLEGGEITQAGAGDLLKKIETALSDEYALVNRNIIAFLESDIENTSPLSTGVSALPNGLEYYNYLLKLMTTTDLSAEEIHQLGLSEVSRLREEMVALKEKSGFEGNLQEFFTLIRESKQDARFYYPNVDDGRKAYIDDASAAIENIKAELPHYFGILPKADLVVKRVEAFREQDGAAQHYYPGTPDGSRPGTYYAHLSDMESMPKNQLEVIAYHEGLPGHHMQISIAQELKSVPTFRRQEHFTAYVEGWALYSEFLAKEMNNTYIDVYSDFGRLSSEIWRGIRLVVDTGLHAKGWTEQQAIEFFQQNSPEPLEGIRSEVRRYLVIPGQATSYKIGMIDILRLRKKAEDTLGDKFDIRGFHDTILGGGALPLTLLQRRVDQWIVSQR